MSCWEILGLPSDADTRSIKRQYATLLKRTRPDDDPEGFQRLREAYEHALNWSDSMRQNATEETAPAAEITLYNTETGLQPRDTGPSAAQRTATRLLEGITPQLLDERFAEAEQAWCQAEFEEQLLLLCLKTEHDFQALTRWGLEHFQWLSQSQRGNLPNSATLELHQRLFSSLEESLAHLLALGDIEGFWREYYNLEQLDWLKSRTGWEQLNELLARLLLNSPFWSAKLFKSVCKLNNWSMTDYVSKCPEPYWTQLLERNRSENFLYYQQQRLELPLNTPENRAAYLLFADIPLLQRQIFAQRMRPDDWRFCEHLAQSIRDKHPRLLSRMPENNPFFWQDLKSQDNGWLSFAAVMLASGVAAMHHHLLPGNGLNETANAIALWSLLLSGLTGMLLWFWPGMADSLWPLDRRLSPYLSPRLSPRSPSPLLLRDLLPCWLIAAVIGVWLGAPSLMAYVGTMLSFGWADRLTKKRAWPRLASAYPTSWWLAWGMMLSVTLSTLGLYAAHSLTIASRNHGLQPWPERLCSRMPASVEECRLPATQQQWYGRETH
ncbi:hypothetical protein SAMN05216598_4755 [Pseudomonas asplenii]|uniref:J domain-containing protein n=1 Tax=Pseudomonas asplenii TaxID=53407 RepID=A0A1H1Z0X1_9PSED|nr:J domain-containing protein [Pseudomonas asplenii]SDT27340.1 hypothetical protein SAMN05216598_4755 [Pseudomonas asplenii]